MSALFRQVSTQGGKGPVSLTGGRRLVGARQVCSVLAQLTALPSAKLSPVPMNWCQARMKAIYAIAEL